MDVQEIIETLLNWLMWIGLSALALIAGGCVCVWLYGSVRSVAAWAWRSRTWFEKFAFTGLLTGCILFAGTKTNSPPLGIVMPLLPLSPQSELQTVTPDEIAQGWRFVVETNCEADVYAMPEGVSPTFNWHRRGTFGEWARLDLGSFAFPLGTNGETVTSFSVFNDGRIRPTPRDSAREICAVGVPMLAMQGASRFWVADVARQETAPYLSKLLTWENFFLNADTNLPVNAQIELFQNGDFTTRSNNVERIYHRVAYFDWDGDGLENSVDSDPLISGPDAHGTNAEWYNVVCSNVLEAVAVDGAPPIELSWREGVNTNAYYFVDVVTTNGPAPIYFTGDRESRLGNPVVVARAFETNHVPLLIGIDYAVTSPVPFTVSFPDDGFATVTTNGVSNYEVYWPLNFVFTESIDGTSHVYSVTIEPFDPGGELTWNGTGGGIRAGTSSECDCGCLHCGGNSVWFSCSSICTCDAECRAAGNYTLENALFAVVGGVCRCGFDDPPLESHAEHGDEPSLAITFSKQAVIFENAYDGSPDVTEPKRSTRVRITVDAYGGLYGGVLSLSSVNLGKLTPIGEGITLPSSRTLAAEESFYTTGVYEGEEESESEGDVSVGGTLTEYVTAQQHSGTNALTVVRVEIKEVATALSNPYVHRRCYGVAEDVECLQFPSVPVIQWQTYGNGTFAFGETKRFCCPITAALCRLYAECKSASFPIMLRVIEPEGIVCDHAEFLPPSSDGRGCGMLLHLLVTPLSVSFSNLMVQEIPADLSNWQQWGGHSGYFDDYGFYQRWCHTVYWGAGVWYPINEYNEMGFDESRMFFWPQPWSDGTLSWKIPYGWQRKNSPFMAPAGQIAPPSYSVWTMNPGFLEKTKHSHCIGVSTNGQMYLDGELKNENR